MKSYFTAVSVALMLICSTVEATAQSSEPTTVVVRAKAHDAKFIGSSMGGALITIRDHATGELLASGKTSGSTGDTGRLMNTPKTRYMDLATPGAARYEATLELEEPVFVTIEATAPLAQKQSQVTVSTQLWLIPGRDITGDGIILEIPGFSVDLLAPQAHERTSGREIPIRANLVMMCGCPVSPGGLWDSDEYVIEAVIEYNEEIIERLPMEYAGKTSTFETVFSPSNAGAYKITVYAYHAETGNTGLDQSTVIYSGS